MKRIQKNCFAEFLKENAVPLVLSITLFHICFYGTIGFQLLGSDDFLSQKVDNIEKINIAHSSVGWLEIFTHNFFVLLPALIGILSFGFISFWYIILQGYLLGVTISGLLHEFSLFTVLKYTLPHGIFEVLSICFLGAFAFKPGVLMLNHLLFHKKVNVKKSLNDIFLLFLGFISFLLISALIEGNITPYL